MSAERPPRPAAVAAPPRGIALPQSALGLDGHPWSAYLGGRPAVVVPQDLARPVLDSDGWSVDAASLGVCPQWSAVLDEHHLTVRRPSGELWLDTSLLVTRDWRRAAHVHQGVLLVTGPFWTITGFPAAAAAGSLRLLVSPITTAGNNW